MSNYILAPNFDSPKWLMKLEKHFLICISVLLLTACVQESNDSQDSIQLSSADNKIDSNKYLEKSSLAFEGLSGEASLGKAVNANDKVLLSYELDLVNGFNHPIELLKIDVIDFEKDRIISSFDSTYLILHLLQPGLESNEEALRMESSGFSIANLWVEIDGEQIPEHIFHRISFRYKDKSGIIKEDYADIILEKFPEQTDLKIELPFRRGKWFYVANAHRDARLLTEGKPTYPQRYAIDWVALTNDRKLLSDTLESLESFKTYGEDILAVKNGVVLFVKDSILDNDPFGDKFATEITRETVAGNYVVLDIGNGICAFYGHLMPGSITVNVGDDVKVGDVIGKLGNGGRSFAPHLHFHLETKSKLPLGGEGVPYILESFYQLTSFADSEIISILSTGDKTIPIDEKPIYRTNQLPIGNGVIDFSKK